MKSGMFFAVLFLLAGTAAPCFAAESQKEEAKSALAMIKKAFAKFPGGLLKSEVCRNDDGSPMVDVGEDGSVKVRVRIELNPTEYRQWSKNLMPKLDAISTSYEDETVPVQLCNTAKMAAGGYLSSDMPLEYAEMASQWSQMQSGMMPGMGGMGESAMHPLMQKELSQDGDDPPSLAFVRDELGPEPDGKTDELTLRFVRAGQKAVWEGPHGETTQLRVRTYKFNDGTEGRKATLIRKFIHEAMQLISEEDLRRGAKAREGARTAGGREGGSLQLAVTVMAGKKTLLRKEWVPDNHRPSSFERQDFENDEIEIVYPLSVSLVSLSGTMGTANDLVISPFLVMDSAHCYRAWEEWVPVGTLSDADLESVTDIRSSVTFGNPSRLRPSSPQTKHSTGE